MKHTFVNFNVCLSNSFFFFAFRDLAKKDRNGASDPFVRVRYNGKTYESTVRTYLWTFLVSSTVVFMLLINMTLIPPGGEKVLLPTLEYKFRV